MNDAFSIADPERALALAYAPAGARPALAALWRLDERFGSVLISTHEPMVGAIRLAWWREALEALDAEPAPAEPLLQEIAATLLPAGITGATLAGMEVGWAALLDDPIGEGALLCHARERGGRLFAIAAAVLGASDTAAAAAGEGWVLADVAFRSRDPAARRLALALAEARLAAVRGRRWPRRLRALGLLAVLAERDVRAGPEAPRRPGDPRRIGRALWHRISGR